LAAAREHGPEAKSQVVMTRPLGGRLVVKFVIVTEQIQVLSPRAAATIWGRNVRSDRQQHASTEHNAEQRSRSPWAAEA
jgi:hypothetical protein